MERCVRVLDVNIVLGDPGDVVVDYFGQALACLLRGLSTPCPGSFHLVENRIMGPVNGIASIYVGTDEVALAFVGAKDISLMRRCVGPQYCVFVDIVRVGSAAADVILWKA